MKRLISWLFGLTAMVAGLQPAISHAAFAKGEPLAHQLSVCLDKDDAVAIVKEHAEKGLDAAKAMWDAKDRCQTVPVISATVGETVLSLPVMVNGEKRTGRVLEIIRGGGVIGYFLTTAPLSDSSM